MARPNLHFSCLQFGVLCLLLLPSVLTGDDLLSPAVAARQLDDRLAGELVASGLKGERPASTSDEQFLRRVSMDLTGVLPSPNALTAFVLDPAPDKRARTVESLAASRLSALHWARYWRDVIFSRAQDRRAQALRPAFTSWLADGFAADRSWRESVSEMITAKGEIRGRGSAALVVAHMGDAKELAAETSRLFLGIQIQCAQCHDHPYDSWKREQFHELAAFFPRVRVRRKGKSKPPTFEIVSVDPGTKGRRAGPRPAQLLRRLDKDGDGRLAFVEVPKRFQKRIRGPLSSVDTNGDGALNLQELEAVLEQSRARASEYFMRDLKDPGAEGKLIHPAFFVTGATPGEGQVDSVRRGALAEYLSSAENPWFARAFVNRVWTRMMGWGFVEPVDDMGPGRKPRLPTVLDGLAEGFGKSGYRLGWLVRTIALSKTYGRGLRTLPSALESNPQAPCPRRLAADELFDGVTRALAMDSTGSRESDEAGRPGGAGGRLRAEFAELFGYDPSTPPDDVKGTLAQALFLMNSRAIEAGVGARGRTPLAVLLAETNDDRVVLDELYLRTLTRFPSDDEVQTCRRFIASVGERREALEDIFWCLLNSTEFQFRS